MKTLILASLAYQIHNMEWRQILIMIFIGAVAGMLAEFIVGSKGFGMIGTIIVGIVGSWLGNWLFKGYLNFTSNDLVNTIICATAGALILVIILSLIFRLRGRDRTDYRA